jgi:hypothetical protein
MSMGIFINYFYALDITGDRLREVACPRPKYSRVKVWMLPDVFERRIRFWRSKEGRRKRLNLVERMEYLVGCPDEERSETLESMGLHSIDVFRIENGGIRPEFYAIGVRVYSEYIGAGVGTEPLEKDRLIAALSADTAEWDQEIGIFCDVEGIPENGYGCWATWAWYG